MAARRLLIALIEITLLASSAACNSDKGYAPTAPGSPAASYQAPFAGTVRDSTGQPIAAATVIGSVQGMPRMNPSTETDASGRFALTLTVPLTPTRVSLHAVFGGYRVSPWTTTYVPGTAVAADIRMQRQLSVGPDTPLTSVLQAGDPTWALWTGRACGPCQLVSIGTDGRQSYVVAVTWSGASQPGLWLTGIDAGYDDFETVGVPIPGERRIEATVPTGVWPTAYVGLPMGVALSEPLAYEISVRPASAGGTQ